MHKRLLSVFGVLVLLTTVLGNGRINGASLQTLDNVAKQLPQKQNLSASKSGPDLKTLGKKGSITPIKSRPGDPEFASGWSLPPRLKEISSISYIVIDANTGETLVSRLPDTPRQPASTIKVLTAMIALKSLDNSDWVRVSHKASDMPRSKVYLDPKKSYRANDLINAVLLSSANDASVALAEKIAGSESNFAKMMTLRAKLWGAEKTVCRTATGLTAEGQQSTARDLASIFRHAMQDEEFSFRMSRVKVRTSYGKLLRNHNKALWRVKGAEGGKTGYTSAARQTYVGQFSYGDSTIIVAIMGSESMWSDIDNLVDYGFKKQKQLEMAGIDSGREGGEVALIQ